MCYKSEMDEFGSAIYQKAFLRDEGSEWNFFVFEERRTCFATQYPFGIFPKKELENVKKYFDFFEEHRYEFLKEEKK